MATVRSPGDGHGGAGGTADVLIAERSRAEAALRESERRLARELAGAQALQAISASLIAEADLDALYADLLDAAKELMHADAASIQQLEPGGSVLMLLAWTGFHPESAAFWARVEAGSNSSCGQALATQQRVIVEDVEASFIVGSEDHDEYRRSRLRAVQSTPLISRSGRPLGMISTHWYRPHTPLEQEFRLFDALVRQAADLVERTVAELALRKSEERQAFLLRLSDALQPLGDPVEIQGVAARLLAEHLGASRGSSAGVALAREVADRTRAAVERANTECALQESEARFRTLFETMDEGFILLEIIRDTAGDPWDVRILEVNEAYARHSGRLAAQDIGRRLRERRPGTEPQWYERVFRVAETGTPERYESYAEDNEDGGRFFDASVYRFAADQVGILFRNVTERRRAEVERERLRVAEAVAAERQALLRRVVEAQEEERRHIAHEIHDSVTQLAAAAALRLDDLAAHLAPVLAPEDAADLGLARDLARRAAAEARRLIAGLRPETLDDFGLTGALQQEVERLRTEGWRATLEAGGLAGVRLVPEVEITLYRVAQEALTNVRKHTRPGRVRVRLRLLDGAVCLDVRDWGSGFDPHVVQAGAVGEHVGLTGMRERLALLGGGLVIRSGPGRGTTISATLPLRAP